jgi:hypothetical protein
MYILDQTDAARRALGKHVTLSIEFVEAEPIMAPWGC